MRKQLDEQGLQSELSGSAFFQPPKQPVKVAIPKKARPSAAKRPGESASLPKDQPGSLAEQPASSTVPPSVLPSVRPPVRTSVRRVISRYAFEFFQDQIETLKRVSLEQKFAGEKGSMSQMVREAVDGYISRTLNPIEEGTEEQESGRTGVRSEGKPQ